MTHPAPWQVRIRVRRHTVEEVDRLARTLSPEASREVPRARAAVHRVGSTRVDLRIAAADTSACRAALNTYLAWVGLIFSTERAAEAPSPS